MRVACTSTTDGNVYRFYRTEGSVAQSLRPIIPFLLRGDFDVIVGSERHDPKLLLRVGPIGGDDEAALISLIGADLLSHCPPVTA